MFMNKKCLNQLFYISIIFLFGVFFLTPNEVNAEIEKVKNFGFTGGEQTFTAPVSGYYQLETWGAQGGSTAGFGAYSTGVVYLDKDQTIYVNVGGNPGTQYAGGYNGGGTGGKVGSGSSWQEGYGGGGATHIAKMSGVLSSLASNTSSVLIVSAGGGNSVNAYGSHGGGIRGVNGYDTYHLTVGYNGYSGNGATTNANGSGSPGYSIKGGSNCGRGSFGKGGNLCSNDKLGGHGGGGGWYGGGGSNRSHGGAGGGSSYIASSELLTYKSITKATYCNSCTESTVAATRTVSVSTSNASPMPNTPKEGSGYAKISLVANDDGRLKTLSFAKGSLAPNFNSDTYYYSISFDSESSFVDVSATPIFPESIVKGIGNIGIPKGTNDLYVTSTSEAGTVVTYTIHTTRPASSYQYLGDIKVDGTTIDGFNPKKLKYEIDVPYTQETLDLEIEKGRFSQEVYLPSDYKLKTGENRFTISVVAEDGSTTTDYEIIVNRAHTSKLKSLTFNNFELEPEFDPETLKYTLKIMANTMSVSLNAVAYDEEAVIKTEGFGYIKATSVGKITVTEPNCKSTVYEITLEKQSADLILNYDFPYTGDVQTFVAPANGYYRLETWGSQGGGNGGYGAYSTGAVYLKEGTKLYIYVGGYPGNNYPGGYNGGGNGGYSSQYGYGGGGATHIATIPGLLSSLSKDREAILIVSAGGGGGGSNLSQNLNGHGGGYIGNNGFDTYTNSNRGYNGAGATLTAAGKCYNGSATCGLGAFGRGGNYCNVGYGGTGGGGGYFGGGGGNRGHGAGGGGTSYIGSTALVSYDTVTKSTYCFGCATSSAESNRTISTSNASSNPTRNYAKKGAGYARISTLRFPSENNFLGSLNITATNVVTGDTTIKNYTPSFDIEKTEYSVTLDTFETSITFLAKPEDEYAKIDGLGTFDVPGGTTDFLIKVMSESGSIRTITVHVTRPESSDAKPINIEVNGLVDSLCSKNPSFCVLDPVTFNPDTHTYKVTVPSKIKQVWFDVTKGHPFQTVTGDGKVSLDAGENDIVITVTSEDGENSIDYHYLITRNMSGNTDLAELEIIDPARDIHFNPDIMEYYFSVPNEYTKINQMKIVPEDPNGKYFVSGNSDFVVGLNEVTITVTSSSGETGIYVLKVYREKNENVYLSNLEVKKGSISYEILPEFNKINTGTYQVTVPNDIDSVDLIATPESVTTKVFGTGNKSLSVGINRFQVITTSETGTTETYYVEITREKNSNTNLSSITVTNGDTTYALDPEFDKNTLTYSIDVSEGVDSVNITATTEVSTTTYKLLDNSSLKVGTNLKRIMTIAEDGSSKVYNIVINRPANQDNYLENIILSSGELNPEFDREKTSYEVEVPYEVSNITVTGVKSNPLSKVNGSGKYALAVGKNSVILSVISESGDIKMYEVTITRKASDNAYLSLITTSEGVWVPDFSKEELNYTITVPSTTEKIRVYGTPEAKTTKVIGNGEYQISGSETVITLTTIAGDNKTTLTYTLTIEKEKSDNNLLQFLLLEEGDINPEFDPSINSYTAMVPYNVEFGTFHVELEDEKASFEILGNEDFVVGENTVTIRVTSESGKINDYVVVVTRQEDVSGSDYLATLTVDKGVLTPAFTKEQQYYEVNVPYNITTIQVSATPEDNDAMVSGRGSYSLETGKNTIVVRVESTDGKIRDYQVVVTREESDEARLSTLTLNDDMLSPNFNRDTFTYQVTTTKRELSFDKIIPVDEKATYEIIGNNFTENKAYQVIIRVTAADKKAKKDYVINVTKNPSKNNNLASLSVLGYDLTPEFNKGTTLYTVTVPNDINSVMIEAVPEDETATVFGDGAKILTVGLNQLIVEVTSESGSKKAYTILLTKEESENNNLSNLIVHNGVMSPEFNTHISNYDVEVEYEEEELDLTVILEDDKATYEVLNNHLDVGENVVEIVVKAEDGSTNTITLNVTRKGISSALLEDLKAKNYPFDFNSYVNHYDLLINYETDELDLTIIPKDKNATIEVHGNADLSVGENVITIEVTASDGTTKETYTLNVTKQKYATTFLDYLYTSEGDVTPDFEKKTLEYSIDVANSVKKIELFGEASDKSATVTGLGEHNLVVGENKLKVTVTAKNGVTRTYYITVNRAFSDANSLESLTVRTGATIYDLVPEFDPSELEYNVTVPIGTLNVVIDATANAPAVVSGTGEKDLHAGMNDFEVVVTSEAGEQKTILIHINREASDNNHLISLIPSIGVLDPEFSYEETNYSLALDSSASVLSFEVITEDENAIVSGTDAMVVPDGVSIREIVIQAEDGSTRTITITVSKEREDNAKLASLSVKDYPFDIPFDPSVFEYRITVPNEKKVLLDTEVIATTEDENAKILKSGNLSLLTGQDNEYLVTVTAPDGFTKQTYKIIITRELGNNMLLESLIVKKGVLSPIFDPETKEYTWTLPKGTTKVTSDDVIATAQDVNAKLEKTEQVEIVKDAENKFIIKVTSEDGSTSFEYVLDVVVDEESDTTLASLVIDQGYYEPDFDPDIHVYDVYEYVDTESITVTATPNDPTSVVSSGNGTVLLNDAETQHEIVVTASNGTTDVTILKIHKTILSDKGLKNLGLNGLEEESCSSDFCVFSPEFESEITNYEIKVPFHYEDLDMLIEKSNEQQTVLIKVDGNPIEDYKLPFGITIVQVEVYDGMNVLTRTYEVQIERADSEENKLLTLESDVGTFDQEFDPDINEYILSLPAKVSEVTFTGTVSNYSTVEGLTTVEVTEAEVIHQILVTSPSGDINTYTITIKKGFSDNTKLDSLVPSSGTLDYSNDVTEYELVVEDSVSFINFVATPNDPDATVTGTDLTSLEYGKNEIIITVTAEDGVTKRVITINVYRKKGIADIIPEKERILLDIDEELSVSYTLNPEDTDYTDVEWKSLDETIATVSETGLITGIEIGKTEVQIISKHDENVFATIEVIVVHKKIMSDDYEIVRYEDDVLDANPNYQNYLIGLETSTKLDEFKTHLKNDPDMLKVYDLNGDEIDESARIGTGFLVKLVYEEEVWDELSIVVRGDLDGNGLITMPDFSIMKNYINKVSTLGFLTMKAADLNKDEKVTMPDFSIMKNYINKAISSVN